MRWLERKRDDGRRIVALLQAGVGWGLGCGGGEGPRKDGNSLKKKGQGLMSTPPPSSTSSLARGDYIILLIVTSQQHRPVYST